ncbi:hypothetical protein GQ53DRAFT_836831 [Thozetella sp. PMI_491]|nr:hypothetical protein GQ53DRAFT_836831 [Thozetella sp. PMI_491]
MSTFKAFFISVLVLLGVASAVPVGNSTGPTATTCGSIVPPYQILRYQDWQGQGVNQGLEVYAQVLNIPPGESGAPKMEQAVLVRFPNLSGHSNCQFIAKFPGSDTCRWRPCVTYMGDNLLSVHKVNGGSSSANPTFESLDVLPGPWGVFRVNQDYTSVAQVVNKEPCDQFSGDFLVRIPDWVTADNLIEFGEDYRAGTNDVDHSEYNFGLFMRYDC